MKKTAWVMVLLGVLAVREAQAANDEQWRFAVTPYLWLPTVDADLGFESSGSGGSPVEVTNILEHLEAALFLNAVASRGDWGLTLDLVYCDFSRTGSKVTSIDLPGQAADTPINAGTTTGLTGSMISVLGSHALWRSASSSFDLLAGVRYTHVSATLDWSFAAGAGPLAATGSAGLDADLWDGVVGVRGRLGRPGSAWFVPMYLDAGTGTSRFTWQGMLGVGYAFRWGDVLAIYRELEFNENGTEGVQHLSFSGPALGATFRF